MRSILSSPVAWLTRLVAVSTAVLMLTVGMALPAFADVVAENSGVRGRGNWTWGRTSLSNLYLGVRDLACDSNDVYVQLRVFYTDGTHLDTTRRYNSNGCGTAVDWKNLYFESNFYISGVTVIACVDDAFSNTCAYSAYHDNPLV